MVANLKKPVYLALQPLRQRQIVQPYYHAIKPLSIFIPIIVASLDKIIIIWIYGIHSISAYSLCVYETSSQFFDFLAFVQRIVHLMTSLYLHWTVNNFLLPGDANTSGSIANFVSPTNMVLARLILETNASFEEKVL